MSKERATKSKIVETLQKRIVPLMELDNGTVEIVRYVRKGGRVFVRFDGAYRGAPCRKILAEQVVMPVLQEVFSGVKSVEYVD